MQDVYFWHKADIQSAFRHQPAAGPFVVCVTAFLIISFYAYLLQLEILLRVRLWHLVDIEAALRNVRFRA